MNNREVSWKQQQMQEFEGGEHIQLLHLRLTETAEETGSNVL